MYNLTVILTDTYIYASGNPGNKGSVGRLISQEQPAATDKCLRFAYHLQGTDGELFVKMQVGCMYLIIDCFLIVASHLLCALFYTSSCGEIAMDESR